MHVKPITIKINLEITILFYLIPLQDILNLTKVQYVLHNLSFEILSKIDHTNHDIRNI